MTNTAFDIAFTQHCGANPNQQDALWNGFELVQEKNQPCASLQLNGISWLLAVADGVALSPAPAKASRYVLERLAAQGSERPLNGKRVREAHEALCDKLARGKTYGSATTLVAAQYHDGFCDVVNVGDSRAYLISASGEWRQLSYDHTILNELIERGEAEAGKAYAEMYKGLAHCLVADYEEDFPIHYQRIKLKKGDTILLCSDGVHDTLGDALQQLFQCDLSPLEQATIWRKAVLKAGAPDNFSLLLLKVDTAD